MLSTWASLGFSGPPQLRPRKWGPRSRSPQVPRKFYGHFTAFCSLAGCWSSLILLSFISSFFLQHQKGPVFIFLSVRNFPFMLWAVLLLLFISDIILVQERFQGTGCILAKPKNILGENLMAVCSEKLLLSSSVMELSGLPGLCMFV